MSADEENFLFFLYIFWLERGSRPITCKNSGTSNIAPAQKAEIEQKKGSNFNKSGLVLELESW